MFISKFGNILKGRVTVENVNLVLAVIIIVYNDEYIIY